MKRPLVLFFPFELLSHYTRCLQLADAIREDYDVMFKHSEKYFSMIRDAGFRTFFCEEFDVDEVMKRSREFDFSWMKKENLEKIFLSQVAAINTHKPDIIVGDAAFTLSMAAQKTGVKHIALMNGYMTQYYAETRKISRTHPAAKYAEKTPEKIFDAITGFAEKIAHRQVHRPFRELRREYSLPQKKKYLAELEGDLNFICDVEEIFPQKNLPKNFSFIGPAFHAGESDEKEIFPLLENGKKNIFVNLGSSGDWKNVAFLNEEKFSCYNIIAAADKQKILSAPNIVTRDFINAPAIMDKIDLLISHGGNGTNYQALAAGVPVLCATSIFEQEWNVHRIEKLGLGASLNNVPEEKIFPLVEFWMQQKNNPALTAIKEKISLETTKKNFREKVRE